MLCPGKGECQMTDGPYSPNKLLRSFPALQADLIKRTTLTIIKSIPEDVYAEIVAHAQ
jgi:cell cycle arrest protein BUB2